MEHEREGVSMKMDSCNTSLNPKETTIKCAPAGVVYVGEVDGAAFTSWDTGSMGDILVNPDE